MGPGQPEPWEQLQGESARAYAGFLVYRDLGPSRSLDQAGLRISPTDPGGARKGRKRGATGRVREWAAEWDWSERARAWDARQRDIYRRAADEATATQAAEWVRRRGETFEREWRLGRLLQHQAERLASLPVVAADHDIEGRAVRIEAVPPAALRSASAVAREGSDLCRKAVEGALGVEASERLISPPDAETRSQAVRELEAWRSEQLRRLAAMPGGPPGEAWRPVQIIEVVRPAEPHGMALEPPATAMNGG